MSTRQASRGWWCLAGGVIVFVVAFSLLERLARDESTGSPSGPTASGEAEAGPPPPELIKRDDGGVEIRHDFFRRTTIRLSNEEDGKALFDCLTRSIEQTFGDGTEGWSRRRVRRETQRIQEACMASFHGLPVPPRPPRPGS